MKKRTYVFLYRNPILAWCYVLVLLVAAVARADQPVAPSAGVTPTSAPSARMDVYEAMKEIVNMQREMEEAFNNHSELYVRSDILKQLVIKAGVPAAYLEQHPEIGFVLWDTGMYIRISEMGGPWTSQDSGGAFTNPNNLHGSDGVLRQSYNYLMNNREFYLEHPPVEEMAYLRHGMNEWRRHILAYHKTLLESLEVHAAFLKYSRYWPRIYQERLAALNGIATPAYLRELGAINVWYEGIKREEEAIRIKLDPAKANVMKFSNALKIADLGSRFGKRIELKRLNDEYLQLEAALKDKNLKGPQRQAAEQRLAEVKRAIRANITKQQEEFGEGWKDYFRDPATARLPGGMLEDDPLDRLKLLANEKYGSNYNVRRSRPVEIEVPIDLNKEDPLVKEREARRQQAAGARLPTDRQPVESVLDEINDVEQPRTAAQVGRDVQQAAKEGLVEEDVSDWERQAAAGMEAIISDAQTPEEVIAAAERNRQFQEEMTAQKRYTKEDMEAGRRLQAARVEASEEARKERLAHLDRESLQRRRSQAIRDLNQYEESLDKRLAPGTRLTPQEEAELVRRETRVIELMQPTAEENAEMERISAIHDQVNSEINRAAYDRGRTTEAAISDRARTAGMIDAATKTWRDYTFTGAMVSEVKDDIIRQREIGIWTTDKVIAVQDYLSRRNLTPEQRAAAEQYLARAIQQRGHAAEAILYDAAVVQLGAAADVGLAAVGGPISRGVSKIFGREAAKQAAKQAVEQAAKQVAERAAKEAAERAAKEAAERAASQGATATEKLPAPEMPPVIRETLDAAADEPMRTGPTGTTIFERPRVPRGGAAPRTSPVREGATATEKLPEGDFAHDLTTPQGRQALDAHIERVGVERMEGTAGTQAAGEAEMLPSRTTSLYDRPGFKDLPQAPQQRQGPDVGQYLTPQERAALEARAKAETDAVPRIPREKPSPPRGSEPQLLDDRGRVVPEEQVRHLQIEGQRLDAALKKYYGERNIDPIHVLDREALNRIRRGKTLTTGDISFSPEGFGILRRGGEAIRIKPGSEKYVHFIQGDARGWIPKYYENGVKRLPNGEVDISKGKNYIPLDHLQYFDKEAGEWVNFK